LVPPLASGIGCPVGADVQPWSLPNHDAILGDPSDLGLLAEEYDLDHRRQVATSRRRLTT
jgi:hypothetical protein